MTQQNETPMDENVARLFIDGENLLEYGADPEYPFDSSAAIGWRVQARRVLFIAHCLWVLQQSDEEVFDQTMKTLKET